MGKPGLVMRAHFEKIEVDSNRSFHAEERRMVRFDAPWHFHPELELTLILESRGRRFVGDSIESFGEGDLVLVGSNLPHFWHNEGRQVRRCRAHSVVIQFAPSWPGPGLGRMPELAAVRDLIERASRGLHFKGTVVHRVAQAMRRIAGQEGLPGLLGLLTILDTLARAAARPLASAAYQPSLDQRAEERLARVYAYLMRNFREPLSLPQVARVAAMSPEGFSRYFKRVTGRNFSVFLTELRVDYAGRLLRERPGRIMDLAAESGFTTLSSFNRSFAARMRATPRAFRRAFREKGLPPTKFIPAELPSFVTALP